MNARQSLIAGGSIEDRSGVVRLSRSRIVRLETTLAAALLTAAFVWSWFRGLALASHLRITTLDLVTGFGAAAILCLSLPFLTSTWASRVLVLREMKGVWDDVLAPLGKSLDLREITILAVFSGLSEEIFFRGVLQAEVGIVAASLLFGLLHPLNLSYVIWAASVGFAFGLLYQMTGSLVPSILCHGAYNFAALLYLRYWYQEENRDHVLLAG
ncbi:MAG: lysostaphin resistance A-like protein [Candidatus Binatia bacterium]